MTHVIRSTVGWAVLGGVAAGVALLIGVDRTDLVLDAYLVLVAFLAALAAARIAAAAFPRPRGVVPQALARRSARPTRPDSLRRIEDVVALGQADQLDLHFRLRPVLQEIAATGLAVTSGADLDAADDRAARAFSPATWSLVRPDRPRPERERARGIDAASLAAVVGELERMLER